MLLLKNAYLYAPEEIGETDLLLCDERILEIRKDLRVPREDFTAVEEIDLGGRPVVPGLVDQHCHLAGGGGEGGFLNRTPPVPFHLLVEGGITTVVGLLGTDGVTRSVQDVLAGARRLQSLGLSGYVYTGAYELPTRTITGSVRSDLVLVPEVLGTGEIAVSDDRSSHPRERDLLDLAAEVRVGALLAGKAGVLHLHVGESPRGLSVLLRLLARRAVPAGLFVATHLNRLPELLSQAGDLTRRGATADLTATILPDPGSPRAVAAGRALADLLAEGLDPHLVTLSSDAGGSAPSFDAAGRLRETGVGRPGSLWEEIRRAVREEGLPLPTALRSVTVNPAQRLGLERKGALRPGADADLLVLQEDLSVDRVFARGRLLAQGGRAIVRDPFDQP